MNQDPYDPDAAAVLAGAEVVRGSAQPAGSHSPRTEPAGDAQKRELDAGITNEGSTDVYPPA